MNRHGANSTDPATDAVKADASADADAKTQGAPAVPNAPTGQGGHVKASAAASRQAPAWASKVGLLLAIVVASAIGLSVYALGWRVAKQDPVSSWILEEGDTESTMNPDYAARLEDERGRLIQTIRMRSLFAAAMALPLMIAAGWGARQLTISLATRVAGRVIERPTPTSLVVGRDLRRTYNMGGRKLEVLRGIDMHVDRGQWLAILGPSGSGKSTLLHILGGLDHPTQGDVRFAGDDLYARKRSEIDSFRSNHVGFVFQFYHLLPELTALENVIISARIGKTWRPVSRALKQRAEALLKEVGLSDRMHHRPNKLSGGERQRVSIARALINDPDLLLADEPTGNLDADTGMQILELFANLHKRGQTIIMVSHDPRVAHAADVTLVLERGRLKTDKA